MDFVGAENVVSAMVHMDEKTPHMHFFHVSVTQDGRLNANKIYTRQSLRKLQSELPAYLQSRGFAIERGVEQTPGIWIPASSNNRRRNWHVWHRNPLC